MRALLIGASGTLGSAIAADLGARHEVITASRSGERSVDLRDPASIDALFAEVGTVDAVVCAAGKTPFVALPEAAPEDFATGFADKLGGQINLVLRGLPHVADGGSFTLITGVLAREPIATGAVAAAANGALDAFVAAAATELPRGIRINAVSPTVLEESMDVYASFFPGFTPVSAAEAARAFAKSVEGVASGRVFAVG